MPRLTVVLALAALSAVPAAVRAQPGAAAGTPDPCAIPAERARRNGQGAAASTGAARDTAPRLLGTPAGASPNGLSTVPGAASSATGGTGTVDGQTPAHAGSGTPGTASPHSPAHGATNPGQASSATGGMEPSGQGSSMSTDAGAQGTAQSAMSAGSAFSPVGGDVCTERRAGLLAAGGDTVIDPRAARANRGALRLGTGELGDQARLGPAASVSVPTAFGVDAGEMFFGIAYQGRTRYTELDDAAAVVGLGIGTRRVLALEAALTTYSTVRGSPLETGGVSFKVHRAMGRQTSLAVGWENAILWGGSDDDGSLYAVATRLLNLREDPTAPFATMVVTAGVGNGRFRFEDDDADGKETVNLFGAVGGRVTPHVSLVADWTGQDLNMAASITPLPRIPAVITVGLADLTGTAGDGARFILSVGYGLAFRQPF